MTLAAKAFFKEKKTHIEDLLKKEFSSISLEEHLKDACIYALSAGGKRLRPLIIYLVGNALNKKANLDAAAVSIEFFHTASLIADDLPCMDNESFRRNKPSVHIAYNEATALLASYALIVAAFQKIHEATETSFFIDREGRGVRALKEVSCAAGIQGATGGQYLDLFAQNIDLSLLETIIYKKTVVLFEVAFALGWIFGGGDLDALEDLKNAGKDLGFAFQFIDDILDQDKDQTKKTAPNIVFHLGQEKTKERIFMHLQRCEKTLERVGLRSEEFLFLLDSLTEYLNEKSL